MMTLTHGELFAGISGFGLGFAQVGIKTKWHVEIDSACQSVLRKQYPDTLLLSDIRDCGTRNLLPVDIISFGSPCQDLSVTGKRRGLNGERSRLFFEAIRVVAELKPTFAVWENVPGALSSNSGRDFAAALNAFRECGARDIAWRVLDARYFGVAQRRRRVFLIADFRGECAAEILFESESVSRDSAQSRTTREEVAGTLGGGSGHSGWNDDADRMTFIPVGYGLSSFGGYTGTLGTQRAQGGDNGGGSEILVTYGGGNTSGPVDVATACNAHGRTGRHDFDSEIFVLPFDTTQVTSNKNYSNPRFGDPCHPIARCANPPAIAFNWQSGGDQRLGYGDPATALQVNQSMATQMGMNVRRLMPVECERLQGFPDGYTDGVSDSARYRMLGNAVCVPVAKWIGRRIVQADAHSARFGMGMVAR